MTKKMYMYDVRGIQEYIFRTNKLKEIIGASEIVRGITEELFKKTADSLGYNVELAEGQLKFKFDEPNDFDAEIFYNGGGNLLVLFEDDDKAQALNTAMRIQLVKDTYSLQLAIAGIEITSESAYQEDYRNLRKEMEKVKLNMPPLSLVSSFPFTLNDPDTGMPFSQELNGKKTTYETKKKLEKYVSIKDDVVANINEMGSCEGDNKIAVIHIDGNNMGKKVASKINGVTNYKKAAEILRDFSDSVDELFTKKALKRVKDKLEYFWEKAGYTEKRKQERLFREVIHAGDDITFICNDKIALQCTRQFIKCIEEENIGKEEIDQFHVCAGIYVMHTHFPFSRGYEMAEQLCDNAKKRSRNHPGNYLDFHINYGGILNDLDDIRDKQYVSKERFKDKSINLIQRPYHVNGTNDELAELVNQIRIISSKNLSRGKIKELREAFYEGKSIVDYKVNMINSRLKKEDRIILNKEDDKSYRILFDAIEIMDLKWGEIDEY